jgi:hypothetical protein
MSCKVAVDYKFQKDSENVKWERRYFAFEKKLSKISRQSEGKVDGGLQENVKKNLFV